MSVQKKLFLSAVGQTVLSGTTKGMKIEHCFVLK